MKMKILTPAAALLAAGLLSGCVAAIGNSGSPQRTPGVSLGQQLIDLQKARDAGAITEAEYTAKKARLLDVKK